MLCRSKPSKTRRRVRRYICILLIIVTLCVTYFEVAVRVQLTQIIRIRMRTAAQEAVIAAVSDFLSENGDAGERLVRIQQNDGGTVAAISTDSAYINYVKTQISHRSQEYIDARSRDEGIAVPLGSFSGLVFLSDLGPDIPLTVGSSSTVVCTFKSTFESAGINQTVHHITLIVDVEVAVYNPFRIYNSITISSDFEIAQTVIVGTVPTYGGVLTY